MSYAYTVYLFFISGKHNMYHKQHLHNSIFKQTTVLKRNKKINELFNKNSNDLDYIRENFSLLSAMVK